MEVFVGVGVSVGSGVLVAVEVGVGAKVSVGAAVFVAVGVFVAVLVGVGVSVGVGVEVGRGVFVEVAVLVGVGVLVEVLVGVGVFVGVLVFVGVRVGVAVGSSVLKSTCSNGAPPESPSNDSPTRTPDPVTIRTIELPLTQPWRSTISWITVEIFEVRWLGPASPAADQIGGFHGTEAAVLGLKDKSPFELTNVGALSIA